MINFLQGIGALLGITGCHPQAADQSKETVISPGTSFYLDKIELKKVELKAVHGDEMELDRLLIYYSFGTGEPGPKMDKIIYWLGIGAKYNVRFSESLLNLADEKYISCARIKEVRVTLVSIKKIF